MRSGLELNTVRSSLARPILYAGAAAILWPVIETIGGLIGARHGAVQVVWLRYSTHLLLLGLVCIPVFGRRAFATRRPVLQLLRGLMMFCMPMFFILARGSASAAWIWTIFWCAPLLVLGAARFVGDRPTTTRWLAAVLAWIGALVMLRPSGVAGLTGTTLAVGMAASFAVYLLLSRVLRNESIIASLSFTAAGALVPTTMIVPWDWRPVGAADLVPALALGMASLLFLFTLDRALEDAPVGLVASLLFAVVALEALRHDVVTGFSGMPFDAVCMALIAVGTIWLVRFSYRSAAASPRPRQDAA